MTVATRERTERPVSLFSCTSTRKQSVVLFAADDLAGGDSPFCSRLALMVAESAARVMRYELVRVGGLKELLAAKLVEEPVSAILISVECGSVASALSICHMLCGDKPMRPVVVVLHLGLLESNDVRALNEAADYMVDGPYLDQLYNILKWGKPKQERLAWRE